MSFQLAPISEFQADLICIPDGPFEQSSVSQLTSGEQGSIFKFLIQKK